MGLVLGLIAGNLQVPAAAQTVTATTGAVNGIVTDSTKAVVPGVTVSLSGPSLMTTRIAVTDEAGAYRFSARADGRPHADVRALPVSRPSSAKVSTSASASRRPSTPR